MIRYSLGLCVFGSGDCILLLFVILLYWLAGVDFYTILI